MSGVQQITPHWMEVSKFLFYPHTEKEYEEAVHLLDELIEKYEDEHVPEITEI